MPANQATKNAVGSPTTIDQKNHTDVWNDWIKHGYALSIHTLVGWSNLYGARRVRVPHAFKPH
jgi:hypothetical protein